MGHASFLHPGFSISVLSVQNPPINFPPSISLSHCCSATAVHFTHIEFLIEEGN